MARKRPEDWSMGLTPIDQEALEQMPEGWFCPEDIPDLPKPALRCKRLNKMGYLESRVGHGIYGVLQYRKIAK